ncbi:alpha/beta fold hydrolase [Blastococcus sp. Marseille-P5729]|uniref:alpha/beta fold hydrolase n=1 Tax=Blastococcus sp. Marseille-P5729 TaxID=2086582 RepID=UPI000D101E13|nr:alpha/beta fold hydrolase [Blastococcus sp. Marseille-P5729]
MAKWFSGRRLFALVAAVLVIAGFLVWRQASGAPAYDTESFRFDSDTAAESVTLDVTVLVPHAASSDDPAPAVILAHGFGGSKESVRADAVDLAERGFVVLTYTARGFGASTGQIHLNAPDAEVADASNLIDYLAERDDVLLDSDGDPRVGIAGGSYGGALALLAAGHDQRVDAIVPMITWNRMARVFFPDAAGAPEGFAAPATDADPTTGVFKREWAGTFFGFGKGIDLTSVLGGVTGSGEGDSDDGDSATGPAESSPGTQNGAGPATPGAGADPVCGRFSQEICTVYAAAAEGQGLDESGLALLDASSPYSVAGQIDIPTMLVQGQADSLFPLSEADVTAAQLREAGATVKMVWTAGGHDNGGVASSDAELARIQQLTAEWFGYYLAGEGEQPSADFELAQRTGLTTRAGSGRPAQRVEIADRYPSAAEREEISLGGPPQTVVRPPGSAPGSLSTLPGLGALGVAFDPPGQAAYFVSPTLDEPVTVVGSPTVTLTIEGMPDGGFVFVKLYDGTGSGLPGLPGGQVAPVVVPPNGGSTTVEVTLPAVAHRFESGHRMILAVASTDRAYEQPLQQQTFSVSLADGGELGYTSIETRSLSLASSVWNRVLIGLGIGAALALAGWLIARARRRRAEVVDHDAVLDDVPLVVTGLRKAYADGFVAVKDVSFRVEREQVVGLLGPNGAGKTTTLRMLMGLIHPTEGELRVFGHRVRPGAPVLSRLGCFVEGVGLMPHLSGIDNLKLYWAATGRPAEDAHFDRVIEIAGLGKNIERKVRTYSQGMRQRVAIAQAMLGLPALLVLDEPTSGLAPPQIAEMRQVLQSYAVDGRAVLVSSHQLAEVEQTCSHVVVVNFGEVIADGTVAEVVGAGSEIDIDVDDPATALEVLAGIDGVEVTGNEERRIMVELSEARASDLVTALVAAGVAVEQVVPRRRLEDAFLALVGGGA